ncbi:hypothetical protein [Baekduia sp. Peel2402]|uniref:hypothetical protein n=1 Tax=Baekduia sp. Peel2402 TaxID=3458296 RepID=UPI00403E771E
MNRRTLTATVVALAALALPATASAHPGWYFINAKQGKKPEIQTITLSGGSWKPSAGAPTLPDTATAAQVQAALQSDLAMIPANGGTPAVPGYDNVRVAGNAGGPYTVTFVGTQATVNVPLLVATNANVVETQAGGGANVTYADDPTGATLGEQLQAVVANDGYTYGFRETNGIGPVADGTAYTGGGGALSYTGAGMINLSKQLPGTYRGTMTLLQKLEYPAAQTGIQVHATCQGVAALENPDTIAAVWDRPDHDPFYNYIPWQKDSAGLGDEPETWLGAVKTATGVDLSTLNTVQDFTTACTTLGGTYFPADTKSATATAAIADAVDAATAPLNTKIDAFTTQVGDMTTQISSLTGTKDTLAATNAKLTADLAVANAALAAAKAQTPASVTPAARKLHLTLGSRRLSLSAPTSALVTGVAGQPATVKLTVSASVAKALKLKSSTLGKATKKIDDQGAALAIVKISSATAKALKKATGTVPVTATATAGSETATAKASVAS